MKKSEIEIAVNMLQLFVVGIVFWFDANWSELEEIVNEAMLRNKKQVTKQK